MSKPAARSRIPPAMRFVILIGVVNLFADMTYEGARSVSGAFLQQLGASAFAVGVIAGSGELLGYAIRVGSGYLADRLNLYWLETMAGYAINLLCVPSLALAGNWPLAAGLLIGERIGRGIRKPVVASMLAGAGDELGGAGRVFGINEALDQIGATIGPLLVAFMVARGAGFRGAFAVLLVPALLALAAISVATIHYHSGSRKSDAIARPATSPVGYWLAVAGGALFAAGYVDWTLISFHFKQSQIVSPALIPVSYAVAMAVSAIAAPFLGRLFDRHPAPTIIVAAFLSAALAPFIFLGNIAASQVGVVLWGVGLTIQETLAIALVARVAFFRRRALVFGTFDLIYGSAWFAGSALLGFLYGHSLVALVVFSVGSQLAAIPFFLVAASKQTERR